MRGLFCNRTATPFAEGAYLQNRNGCSGSRRIRFSAAPHCGKMAQCGAAKGRKTMKYIIVLDAGTTSVRAFVYDLQSQRFIHCAQQPVGLSLPRSGWVEQDADEIYYKSAYVINDCMRVAGASGSPTSARRSSCGSGRRASLSAPSSAGSAAVQAHGAPRSTLRRKSSCGRARGLFRTRTFPQARSYGILSIFPPCARSSAKASCVRERSTVI